MGTRAVSKYVVTAFERSKGYRVSLSQRMSKSAATGFSHRLEAQNELALPEYRYFSDFKIEKRQPEYV